MTSLKAALTPTPANVAVLTPLASLVVFYVGGLLVAHRVIGSATFSSDEQQIIPIVAAALAWLLVKAGQLALVKRLEDNTALANEVKALYDEVMAALSNVHATLATLDAEVDALPRTTPIVQVAPPATALQPVEWPSGTVTSSSSTA